MHLNSTLYTPKKNLEINLKFKKTLRNSMSYFGYKIRRRTDGMSVIRTLTYCVTTLNKVVHYGSHKEAFEAYEVTESPKAVYELDCTKGTCKGININCNLHDYDFMHLQEKMRMRNFKIIS